MHALRSSFGDATTDALIQELTALSVAGYHPIDQTRAENLVGKFEAVVQANARKAVIPVIVVGTAATTALGLLALGLVRRRAK